MARSFDGSTQYLRYAGATITGVPLTLAAWFYTDSATASQALLSVNDADSTSRFQLNVGGNTAGDPVRAVITDSTTTLVGTTTGYSTATWHHAAANFDSSNIRAWIDGGSKGFIAHSKTPTGIDQTDIGIERSGSYLDGNIAHAAIWNVALSDAEIGELYNGGIGLDPRYVRPDALVGYWPLVNHDRDLSPYHYDLTATNDPTFVADPLSAVERGWYDDDTGLWFPSSSIVTTKEVGIFAQPEGRA